MADNEALKRIAEFIEPFRVEPGAQGQAAQGLRPGRHLRDRQEEGGRRAPARGVELLTEYQARLAAQDTQACSWCSRPSTPPARTARSATS